MCMRSISRTCKHYSHPKLGVLCDTLMRNWCETWLFWPKIAWRVGACSDENCKIETQGLQIHVDGRKPSHQVQINFHILLCWVWSLALPWTFWPWDFSDPELSCPWRSKWLLTQWGEPVGGKPLGLEQPTEQICSSTGLMCCINTFGGLCRNSALCLVLAAHWLGIHLKRANLSMFSFEINGNYVTDNTALGSFVCHIYLHIFGCRLLVAVRVGGVSFCRCTLCGLNSRDRRGKWCFLVPVMMKPSDHTWLAVPRDFGCPWQWWSTVFSW